MTKASKPDGVTFDQLRAMSFEEHQALTDDQIDSISAKDWHRFQQHVLGRGMDASRASACDRQHNAYRHLGLSNKEAWRRARRDYLASPDAIPPLPVEADKEPTKATKPIESDAVALWNAAPVDSAGPAAEFPWVLTYLNPEISLKSIPPKSVPSRNAVNMLVWARSPEGKNRFMEAVLAISKTTVSREQEAKSLSDDGRSHDDLCDELEAVALAKPQEVPATVVDARGAYAVCPHCGVETETHIRTLKNGDVVRIPYCPECKTEWVGAAA